MTDDRSDKRNMIRTTNSKRGHNGPRYGWQSVKERGYRRVSGATGDGATLCQEAVRLSERRSLAMPPIQRE